jgi:hypothetical protein
MDKRRWLAGASSDPASIAEAVELAAAGCEHLVLLDEARTSVARAAYRQSGRLWRALVAMDEVASRSVETMIWVP